MPDVADYPPPAGDTVRFVYRKYDGSLHWHGSVTYLGEDEHGWWCGAPGGWEFRRGQEPPVVAEQAWAFLAPREVWWTAVFNDLRDGVKSEVYCDIATPARWSAEDGTATITSVDLDLDVIRRPDGAVVLVDEDEYELHRERYAYPADVRRKAEAAAARLMRAVAAHEPPFDAATYTPWLDRVR